MSQALTSALLVFILKKLSIALPETRGSQEIWTSPTDSFHLLDSIRSRGKTKGVVTSQRSFLMSTDVFGSGYLFFYSSPSRTDSGKSGPVLHSAHGVSYGFVDIIQ